MGRYAPLLLGRSILLTKLRDYLQNNVALMDGAMGTYFASKVQDDSICESANITNPKLIREIHEEYINAGAKLIRTNTFSANPYTFNGDFSQVKNVIEAGYNIAKEAVAGRDIWIAGSIGPIPEEDTLPEDLMETYYMILDIFIEIKIPILLFETFSDIEPVKKMVKYLHEHAPEIEVLAQFSISSNGYTKKGISINRLINELKEMKELTAFGFNCGVGAGHMLNLLRKLDITGYNIAVSPNAGYPEMVVERTHYRDNANYFAEKMQEIAGMGVKIIGGCCGTTPLHIQNMAKQMGNFAIHTQQKLSVTQKQDEVLSNKAENAFSKKLEAGEFVVAVELDPPFGYDISKLMDAAHIIHAAGVDIITIADSPLGRVRLDAIITACRIKREVGIDVMPHVCCRDRNRISLQSTLMAAHVEGLRNFLFVTGDPVPEDVKGEVKGVFQMNSIRLMSYGKTMNSELPDSERLYYGGALYPKGNIDAIIRRVSQKKEAGCEFLLTQPIFDEEAIENIDKIKKATGIKILGGILPLVSYKNARFIDNEFTGMQIPKEIIERFKPEMTREQAEDVGISIAVEMGRKMKSVVDGFYFMTPFNRATMIAKILRNL